MSMNETSIKGVTYTLSKAIVGHEDTGADVAKLTWIGVLTGCVLCFAGCCILGLVYASRKKVKRGIVPSTTEMETLNPRQKKLEKEEQLIRA
jgi:hypothetical protein